MQLWTFGQRFSIISLGNRLRPQAKPFNQQLEIMHGLEKPDYQGYFMSWARVWCRKAREEYIQLLLTNDVHSPGELRANMTPRNFPEWYEAFGVTEADQMYIAPAKRISIW